jgi:hypothetical protein
MHVPTPSTEHQAQRFCSLTLDGNVGEHFSWSTDGTEIIGQTPTGRATVTALRLNDALIVAARALWTGTGLHPPQDE